MTELTPEVLGELRQRVSKSVGFKRYLLDDRFPVERGHLSTLLDIAEREAAARKRVEEVRRLHLRAALCLSGFAGEGLSIAAFEDPADVFCSLVEELGMDEADDEDLRAALSPTEQEKG